MSAEFTDIDSVLFPLLAKIDRDLAASRFKERLSAWRGSETTFPLLVSMVDEHFGSRFAEEVIRALAVLCKNSRYPRVPFDLIKVIRDDWKVPEEFVNQFGGKDLSALIYR